MSLSVLSAVARSNEHATILKEKSASSTSKSLHYIDYQATGLRYDITRRDPGQEKNILPTMLRNLG
jgi:hypothetical protein